MYGSAMQVLISRHTLSSILRHKSLLALCSQVLDLSMLAAQMLLVCFGSAPAIVHTHSRHVRPPPCPARLTYHGSSSNLLCMHKQVAELSLSARQGLVQLGSVTSMQQSIKQA